MTRRTFVIAIGIAIAFCLGVYFYAQWDMKRFDTSLPGPPAADTVVETPTETAVEDTSDAAQPAAETSAGHWHGDEWHEEPHSAAPDPPAHSVAEKLQLVKEVAPWRAEWRAALEHHKTESKRLREKSRAVSLKWEALKKARDENRISPEEYAREQGNIVAALNVLARERQEQAAALRAAEAKTVKGGND